MIVGHRRAPASDTAVRLLAIDLGPENSSGVEYDAQTGDVVWTQTWPNDEWLIWLNDTYATDLAIEMVASYGMAVGADVFETVFWIGRFADRWETGPRLVSDIPARRPAMLVYRRDVKLHLCGQANAKDANVRQVLIDRYGPGRRGRLV